MENDFTLIKKAMAENAADMLATALTFTRINKKIPVSSYKRFESDKKIPESVIEEIISETRAILERNGIRVNFTSGTN